MNELDDMVCYLKKNEDNIYDLYWNNYRLQSTNTESDGCNFPNFHHTIVPMGLHYLNDLNIPLKTEPQNECVDDSIIKKLMMLTSMDVDKLPKENRNKTKANKTKKANNTKKANGHYKNTKKQGRK